MIKYNIIFDNLSYSIFQLLNMKKSDEHFHMLGSNQSMIYYSY